MPRYLRAPQLIIWLSLLALAHSDKQCSNRAFERREHGVDDIPFIVYIEFQNLHRPEEKPSANAAGILIDRNMVLTRAYHCEVASASSFKVYPGQTYVHPKLREHQVAEYKLHPQRKGKTYDEDKSIGNYAIKYEMDFCLLRLKERVFISASIQMAPLPAADEAIVSKTLMVSGWGPFKDKKYVQGHCASVGGTEFDFSKASLFYHMAPVESTAQCAEALQSANVGLHPSLFCLGFRCKNFHTAHGDDGGPVFDTLTKKVVGMVLNVRQFDDLAKPQLNIRTSFAVKWINEVRVEWVKVEDDREEAAGGGESGVSGGTGHTGHHSHPTTP